MEMRWFSSSANFKIENSLATLSSLIMFYLIFDLLVRVAASRLIIKMKIWKQREKHLTNVCHTLFTFSCHVAKCK